jgi:peptide/nickel transport system permease protein
VTTSNGPVPALPAPSLAVAAQDAEAATYAVWQPTADDVSAAALSPRRLAWRRFRRNRLAVAALILLVVFALLALLAPIIAPYDPIRPDVKAIGKPPSLAHPFGTDESGRDMLSRLLHGARVSLSVGFVAVTIYITIGTLLGALAGYRRGWVDGVIGRSIDLVQSFPSLIIILGIVPLVGRSLVNIMLVIGLLGWPSVARLVRGEFLSLREREHTLAARGIGAKDRRIIGKHILPNVAGPLIVLASFGIADAIIIEAGLSVLGLGIQPPAPSWGVDLSAAIDIGILTR